MDFGEFLESKLWIHIVWGPEPDETVPEQFRPKKFDARIAYAPGKVNDEDLSMLAMIGQARMAEIDLDAIRAAQAEADARDGENRAQRRSQERAERRANATPIDRIKRPSFLDYLERLVVDWDLVWRDKSTGETIPVPITRETLNMLEPGLKVEIVSKIMADYLDRPNLTTLSGLFSGTKTANGQSSTPSASEPSSTV